MQTIRGGETRNITFCRFRLVLGGQGNFEWTNYVRKLPGTHLSLPTSVKLPFGLAGGQFNKTFTLKIYKCTYYFNL